jgi:AcrR family transcriptional regulator
MRGEGFSLYVIQQVLSQKSVDDNLPHTDKKTMVSRQSMKGKESKREEIIRAAGKIFSEKGYYQTNISDITNELGIGKSSFYLSFKNKKEVFLHCIDDIFENLWKEDFVRIKKETDMRSRLRLRGEAFIRVYPRIKDILQLVRGASVSKEEGFEGKYNEIYAKFVRPVIRDLKKGIEQGVFPEIDPELTAYALVGSLEAIAYRIHLDNKYTIEEVQNVLRQFRFRG